MELQIPGYRIEERIAQGGMGAVYRAVQEDTGGEVAIKIIKAELVEDEEFTRRFLHESRVVAKLEHPYIVKVFAAGFVNGLHYLTMQYLSGGTLQKRLREGLPPEKGIKIVCMIAEALGYAHARGYVHRDVKPGNILFYSNGTPVLSDFGLVKTLEETQGLTMTNRVFGSPPYMSPEQWKAEKVDGRADLYSLGVVLFEVLAGQVPYIDSLPHALMYRHLQDPIPKLPPKWRKYQSVIDRAMAKEPDKRYATAEEFITALEEAERAPAPLPSPDEEKPTVPVEQDKKPDWAEPERLVEPVVAQKSNATGPASAPLLSLRRRWRGAVVMVVVVGALSVLYYTVERRDALLAAGQKTEQERLVREAAEREYYRAGREFQDDMSSGQKGPTMVVIPAGEFAMGSPESESEREDDEKQHSVRISRPFAIARHEVTVGEFRQFVEATGYRTDAERNVEWQGCFGRKGNGWDFNSDLNWRNPGFEQTDQHPVVCVSWNDAQAYIQWFAEETKQAYRLPTEAEWEYAARGKTTTIRYWGEDADAGCSYANGADQTAKAEFSDWTIINCRDRYVYTAPVGSYQTNQYGLYDVLGNVLEWCQDVYIADIAQSPVQIDPAYTNGGSSRVFRGGGWRGSSHYLRSASRGKADPARRLSSLGFRLARTLTFNLPGTSY